MAGLWRCAPAVALMGLIFFLSAQPDLSSGLGTWDTVLRKGAHMTEFGLLFLLWVYALRGGRRRAMAAALIAIAYAATDELHQAQVEGRHGSPVDVAIDAVGVALAALVLRRLGPRRAGQPPAAPTERPA